jgi:hypothetical protein
MKMMELPRKLVLGRLTFHQVVDLFLDLGQIFGGKLVDLSFDRIAAWYQINFEFN